ncbi:uncharacterized protein LY89DRAFT_786734 [Mollisia scopiformis]|uniref:Prenylcysteine lyase domain-containing protein n=1 Tax=Mollisia scopiformis TaxID=149040 RepID=A0A194WT01_MOLSC|nr:uncharacterized protein LY89DRAFT_786734 [Mollisia scopiformis]KUJ11081.1 hypothetical protein LY89DRAFT_786734 [Mollisia scopiformis]
MRTSKSTPDSPPPAYTSTSRSQPPPRIHVVQESTPLLYPNARYTYIPPPNTTQSHYNPLLYRPLYLRPSPTIITRGRSNKTCRYTLLALLSLSILVAVFKTSFPFPPFHPPSLALPPEKAAPVRIAIIGAGPAGVGAAWALAELQGSEVEVVVVEREERVGGRMNLGVDLRLEGKMWGGQRVEIEDVASAELFADERGVVRRRAEGVLGLVFGEDKKKEGSEEVGFFDGGGFVVRMTRPGGLMGWKEWAGLVLKYGKSFLAARNVPTGTMGLFRGMVELGGKETFEGVEEWVQKAGLRDSVEMSARERLSVNGVGDAYRKDIIESQVRRQLGQGTEEISDLALSLALWREEIGGPRPKNGIKMETVLKQLLERSGAEVRLGTSLQSMKQEHVVGKKSPVWRLGFKGRGYGSEVFDKVILTTPWGEGETEYYRRVTNTFLISEKGLKAEYFNVTNESDLPAQILPVRGSNLPEEFENIHEISHVKNIFGPDVDFGAQSVFKMYKVLSDKPLSEQTMRSLWERVRFYSVQSQRAYPLLFPRNSGFGSFKVHEGVWNTATIEHVASSVDLSWAAGENVAKLIKQDIEE